MPRRGPGGRSLTSVAPRADIPVGARGRLGLGCAGLFGLPGRRDRLRVLAAAHDAGIRHFDVAPIYGLGAGEPELGRFLRTHPGCTVTTKFGLGPTAVGRAAGLIQSPIRSILQRSPAMRDAMRSSGGSPETGLVGRLLYARRSLDVRDLRTALDGSRRALGREMIDVWLLHDPPEMSAGTAMVVAEFLDRARGDGLVGEWGVAGSLDDAGPGVVDFAARGQVVQSAYDLIDGRQASTTAPKPHRSISYGCLSRALPQVSALLAARPDLARECSDLLDADVTRLSVLAGVLLRDALIVNPHGMVLFSTTKVRHLEQVLDEIDRQDRSVISDVEVARRLRAGMRVSNL